MASPHLESLSAVSTWPLVWVRFFKDFAFDLGCVAVLGLFVQWLLPRVGLGRRLLILLPTLLVFFLGSRGMPELWSRWILGRADALDRTACDVRPQWMVILGGGFAGPDALAVSTLSRLGFAAETIRGFPEAVRQDLRVVVSGGPTLAGVPRPESHFMKAYLLRELPNMKATRVIEENSSLNTRDNAVHVSRILGEQAEPAPVHLVTSRLHMPRAFASFLAAGMKTCPVSSPAIGARSEGFINFRNADRSVRVINEYAGLLGYRLKGWIH